MASNVEKHDTRERSKTQLERRYVSRAVSKQRVAKSVRGTGIFFPPAVTGEQGRTVLDLYRLGIRSVGTAGLKSSLAFISDDQVTDAEAMDGRESSRIENLAR